VRDASVQGGFREAVGDKLFLRQAYPDGMAATSHITSHLAPCVEALLSGPLSLDSLEVHGSADSLATCSAAVEDMGPASVFETLCGVSFLEKPSGGVPLAMSLTAVHSRFTVADWALVSPILDDAVERTRANERNGCIYSGFSRSGNELCCTEAFGSPAAVARHVENVATCAEALLAGPAVLTRTAVHSSELNLRDYKEQMRRPGVYGDAQPLYFCKGSSSECGEDGGFSRFEVQQSLNIFGFTF